MSYSEYECFGVSTSADPQPRPFQATCREDGCLRVIAWGCGAQCRECYEREQSRRMRDGDEIVRSTGIYW